MFIPGLTAFAAAAAVVLLLAPPVWHLAVRAEVVDRPDRLRKLHRRLVPLWGGLAVFPALAAGAAAAYFFSGPGGGFESAGPLLAGGAVLLAVGLIDDRRGLPPKVKLASHLVAAALAVGAGLWPRDLPWFGAVRLAVWPPAGMAFAVLWLVFMTNAFNFIDGLDGLASGHAAISGAALALAAAWMARPDAGGAGFAVILAAAAGGAALGFWRYNRPPARIFLGDAGATLLGFTLAAAALAATVHARSPWALLAPPLLLAWPIADTLLAVGRRLARSEPVSRADHKHLHHRLLAAGYTPGAAAALILTLAIFAAVLGLAAAWI